MALKVLNMAMVIVKMRVMPDSPDIDLDALLKIITEKINKFCDKENAFKGAQINPVAFGLKALDITFAVDEKRGDTEPLEMELSELEGVTSVEVTSVSRALG